MAKRGEPVRRGEERRRPSREPGVSRRTGDARRAGDARRTGDAPPRGRTSTREQRPQRARGAGPKTAPIPRPTDRPGRPKNTAQAKARSKARKAKAPKVVRPPLRERLLVRIAAIHLSPRELVSRVPFVVLVIGALGLGLGVTLWLSTDAAERSYELGHARQTNQALLQQKEALERDVLAAQAAPALAESARKLGMIPSKDTAHLVQDASGNWVVVGTPKPAAGVSPPPLNTPLPEEVPPAPPAPPAPRVIEPREQLVRIPSPAAPSTNPRVAAPGIPAAVPGAEVPTAPAPGVPPDAGVRPAGPPTADAQHLASPQAPALPGPPVGAAPPTAPVPGPAGPQAPGAPE